MFTGGSVELINKKTGKKHLYTLTAEKIIEYAKNQTDNG